MKLHNESKKRIHLVLALSMLFVFFVFSAFAEEIQVGAGNTTQGIILINISKQIQILDAIESAQGKLRWMQNNSFDDLYSKKMHDEMETTLSLYNHRELVGELNRTGRPISMQLMFFIGGGLDSSKMPDTFEYNRIIELNSNISKRADFIYNLKSSINNLRWKTDKELFWIDYPYRINLSSLSKSEILFGEGRYDEASETFNNLTVKLELKKYQVFDKGKESLEVLLECENILESIKKDGFNDEVANSILRETKDFFTSKKFYPLLIKIENLDDSSWKDSKELLLKSNLSSQKPINEDYDKLADFRNNIAARRNQLISIRKFINNLDKVLNDCSSLPELNCGDQEGKFNDAMKLFSEGKYDKSYEESVFIEAELEDRIIEIILNSNEIIRRLNSSNFTVLYVSDLLNSVYDKFAPFQSSILIKRYAKSGEKDKLALVQNELLPIKESSGGGENSYGFVDFTPILKNLREIKYRETQIYRIDQTIKKISGSISNYAERRVNVTLSEKLFQDAVSKFRNEEYDKTESLLFESATKLESAKSRLTVLNVLAVEGLSFLQRNKYNLLIIFALLFALSFYSWMKLRVKFLEMKLNDFNTEKSILENLIKKAQIEHFGKEIMPTSVYNVKYEEFNERLNSVKASIPVVETNLSKQLAFNNRIEGFILKLIRLKSRKNKPQSQKEEKKSINEKITEKGAEDSSEKRNAAGSENGIGKKIVKRSAGKRSKNESKKRSSEGSKKKSGREDKEKRNKGR